MAVWWRVAIVLLVLGAVAWGASKGRAPIATRASPPRAVNLSEISWLDQDGLRQFSEEAARIGYRPLMDFELAHIQ